MQTKTFRVPNITCGHCVMTIERELSGLEGVTSVMGDEKTKIITVQWDETSTDWHAVRHLLEEISYPPEEE